MDSVKPKLLRITTIPISLKVLLRGQHDFMSRQGFCVVGVSSFDRELHDVAKIEKVRVIALEMTRKISPIRDLVSLWYFYQLCMKEEPNIVHSHTPKAGIVAMLGAKLAGVPIRLHTVAGLPLMGATGMKRQLLNLVEKITYACATKVYPNSKGLYDFILENKFASKRKLHFIANGSSNGIDTTFFDNSLVDINLKLNLKKKLGIQHNDFVFVFVGRLVVDKGIHELVNAFSEVSKEMHNIKTLKLLLVGYFEEETDSVGPLVMKEIQENEKIIHVGFQEDVRPYFAISNCLAFPSYREGFPNVVMQAGAMGLPSIVSDINGCNEIIIENINGTVVPPKNKDALKAAMLKMCNDIIWKNKLALNARNLIVNRFEQQIVWQALLNEYNQLLDEKGLRK